MLVCQILLKLKLSFGLQSPAQNTDNVQQSKTSFLDSRDVKTDNSVTNSTSFLTISLFLYSEKIK